MNGNYQKIRTNSSQQNVPTVLLADSENELLFQLLGKRCVVSMQNQTKQRLCLLLQYNY